LITRNHHRDGYAKPYGETGANRKFCLGNFQNLRFWAKNAEKFFLAVPINWDGGYRPCLKSVHPKGGRERNMHI